MAQPVHWQPQDRPEMVQVPDGLQQHAMHGTAPHVIRPRRNHPLNVQIHHAGDSSSPSPPTALRKHRRHHSRTPSEIQRYEELKRLVRDREGRDHAERQRRELAERNTRAAVEARRRAEWEMERVRRQNEELVREERRRLGREDRLRFQERERRRQEQEERRQRRIRLEEQRQIEEAQAERRRDEEAEFERERARIRQETEDRQRLQEAVVRDRIRRDRNERDRMERQRRAGIPHRPRHQAEVHHRPNVSFDERGDRVIDDAIRAENRRQFESRAPLPTRGWSRRRDVGGGLRRRDTIAVTQRRVYEDDRARAGRRFI